ncbi:hypothetical protein K8I31_11260 [bacterium]|nr:hypothetical protein [bacterium]
MKRLITTLGLCLVSISFVCAQSIVPFTSFEDDVEGLWTASGGMSAFSLSDTLNSDYGVQPQDGEWHLEINYDLALNAWGNMDVIIPNGETVDITGMSELHFFTYFTEDAAEHQDGDFRMRLTIGAGRELGTQTKTADEVQGQWAEWIFPIDHIIYDNLDADGPVDALDRVSFRVNPGGDATVVGTFFIDNIFFSRPASTPDSFELIQLWSFDEDVDEDIIPDGWQLNGLQPLIGDGWVEPSEGTNYMELDLGGGWTTNGASADAKARSDRLIEAKEAVMDLLLPADFTGTWLNLQLILQSGGTDADGNNLAPVNGWDAYGERGVAGFTRDEWHTIAWPINMERHRGALEDDGGWFQFVFSTNQDASMSGIPIFVDNFRIAVPAGGSDVTDWSVF